jgi:AraC-like DNA-binding protein
MNNDFEIKKKIPDSSLSDYVESFWMLINHAEEDKEIVVLPDGRIDISFSYSAIEPFQIILLGLENEPTKTKLAAKTVIFAISFKLLAVEYVLKTHIAHLVNNIEVLPTDFWGITKEDLNDFDEFCKKMSATIKQLLITKIDSRKQKLFELIYSSNDLKHGYSLTVKELSAQVSWSSRQINRYFSQNFGISLKSYCNILRFRASFQHIKEGKLFPEHNFTDQPHFIREVKRFSGVIPKELNKNKNDRFIHFSTLPKNA